MNGLKILNLTNKLCLPVVFSSALLAAAEVKALDVFVGGTTYDVQFYTGSFDSINADTAHLGVLTSAETAPWLGNPSLAGSFRSAYYSMFSNQSDSPYNVSEGTGNDLLAFAVNGVVRLVTDDGLVADISIPSNAAHFSGYTVHYAYVAPVAPTNDADGSLIASPVVSEPVNLNTTVDTMGEAIDVFDFTLIDGGSGDGLAMTVSDIVLNVSGTANDAQRSNITWRLNGPDASNVTGTYNGASDTITFSGLSISVADGASETYTVNAYFNDNANVSEDLTLIMSVDGDTDLTTGSSGTHMGSTSAVTNGTGTTLDVVATQLAFTTQPAGSTSGSSLITQPVVAARDAFGNTDVDFSETVTLTEGSAGTLTGNTVVAVNGVATFSSVAYTATVDQQSFTITANDQDGIGSDLATVDANAITSDVVATKLVFNTEPAPTTFTNAVTTALTSVPVVDAVDDNGIVDSGYSTNITLSEVNGGGSAVLSGTGDNDANTATITLTPSSGVATFSGLAVNYASSTGDIETFNLQATSGALTSATSNSLTTVPVISSVAVPSNATYAAGSNLDFIVNFTGNAYVSTTGGTPSIPITIGTTTRQANYLSGSGSTALTFRYTVLNGDEDTDGISVGSAIEENGGSVDDSHLNRSISLLLSAIGNTTSVLVDGIAPMVQGVSFTSAVVNGQNASSTGFGFSGDGEIGASYSYTISSSGGGTAVTGNGTLTTSEHQVTGLDLSGLGDGILTASVVVTDTAGNASTVATDTVLKDTTAPTVTLTSNANAPHSGLFTVTATFSESVTGFAVADVIVGNGSASNFQATSATVYTFDVTPTADGAVTVDVAANVAEDAATNGNTAATQLSVTTDGTAPTVTLTSNANDPHSGVFTVTATFSESVTGFALGDVTVGSGTASNLAGSGTTYAFDVTPSADGAVTVDVAANVAADAAGNTNTAATQLSVTTDGTAPTVALTSNANDPHSGAFTVTATFSEAVTGFELGDITVGNGIASNFQTISATVYTFDVTSTADGAVTVDIAANVAEDAATNGNTAATQLSVTSDGTAPTVTLTSNANDPHSGLFTVTATFAEAVTGFALADITVGNGSASNFQATSATVYTFDVTPTADGAVTVDVAANVAEDAATNGNTAATQLIVTSDNTDPVVTISGPTEVVVDDFTVTLIFSEVVTGFAAEDITVTNGEKGTFTETTPGKVYTLVVTPELGKTVAVSIPADKAQDAAGNGNEASDVFEVSAGSPASEFEKDNAEIKQDIVAEVQNTLQNAVTANVRMVKDAKSRFIASTRSSLNGPAGFAGQNNVPFDVDSVANGTAMRLSTNGTFFGQVGNDEGTKRRVFFGDFSIVGEKGGSVTGSISGKVAWEQNLSDKTMYGYFIGAQVNQTDIKTTFTGKQQGYGVNIGSYVVNEVAENVYIDGFVSLGMGKSDLDMSNDVLSLDGSYETKSATIGGALTGVYDMESYEFWPELAFTAGKTQVGTAKFTGRAYGLVDNNLSLDAGDVTVANLTLRPEVRIPLEAGNQSGATSQVTFAPRAICERITTDVTTENCGRGAELGFIRKSGDGLTQITGRLSRDYVGTSTRTGLELKLEHRF